MIFYLGTHETSWLGRLAVPLFVSDRRLRRRVSLPVARARWALDSGAFSVLAEHGSWEHGPTPHEYAGRVRMYREEIGLLDWAAPQDWMCEPWITAKTGLSVVEHQARTVGNFAELRAIAPDLPFVPVLQGWTLADYLACVQRYERAGVDLQAAPVVGLGSVCRRQATGEIAALVIELAAAGISLHGFGVKTAGVAAYGHCLASADSMAWSYSARRRPPLPGHTHRACSSCSTFALAWREQVVERIENQPVQLPLTPTDPPLSG